MNIRPLWSRLRLSVFVAAILTLSLISASTEANDLWQSIGPNGKSLAVSPNFAADHIIYAGSDTAGIVKSSDGGTSWTPINNGLTNMTIWTISLSPGYPSDHTLFAGTDGGIFKSTNDGVSWAPAYYGIPPQSIRSLALSPNYLNDQTLFAGTWGGGLYKSTDGGMTWSLSGTGISEPYFPSIAFSPAYSVDRTIFAGTWTNGVFKSTDGGANWNSVGIAYNHTIHALAVSPGYATDQTIYVGIGGGGGVMKSMNGGASWEPVNNGISNLNILSMVISPGYADDPTPPGYPGDRTLYSGTFGGGVFRSSDGGSSWTPVSNGLSNLNAWSLAISPVYRNDLTVFAGTDTGLFKLASPSAAPVVSAAPTGLSFGDQSLNTSSMEQSVTISNNGGAPLAISAISITDANPAQYAITSYGSCGTPNPYLTPGTSCTVYLRFLPTTEGTHYATLMISSNDPVTPISAVPLYGVGVYIPAPTVVATQPANGTTAPLTTTVQATFSEQMDEFSITTATFNLSQLASVGIKTIAAGNSHSVALKSDGTVTAWGDNSWGQSAVPGGLTGVTGIAAGESHTLAVTADGMVSAWGKNDYNQSTVPEGLSGVIAVAAGGSHSLALKGDGTVTAWGSNQFGQATPPEGLTGVIAITAGSNHSVALKGNGTVVAWGHGVNGQTTIPEGLSNVTAIAAGGEHSLALKNDGTVVAWGYGYYGQTTVPEGLSGVIAVAAGGLHSLALKNDGTVVAWGYNILNQSLVPSGLSGVKAIAAGYVHSLAVKNDNMLVGWGYDGNGQISIPEDLHAGIKVTGVVSYDQATQTATFTPAAPLVNAGNYLAAITGVRSLAGITLAAPVTWSFTALGPALQLAPVARSFGTVSVFSATTASFTLTNSSQNPLSLNTVAISGADAGQFVITAGSCGSLTPTLAANESCQLQIIFAPDSVSTKNATLQISAGSPAIELSASLTGTGIAAATYPLYLEFDGPGSGAVAFAPPILAAECSASCTNTFTGGTSVTLSPAAAAGSFFAGWTGCDSVSGNSCTVTMAGARNVSAHFATGGSQVKPAVVAGMANTLILKNDGTVWRWGGMFNGSPVPQQLTELVDAVAISTGTEHSVAITSEGRVRIWGGNSRGQLGSGLVGPRSEITGLTDITAIAAGHWYTAAVRADGTVWSFGDNSDGCLGDGTTTLRGDLVQAAGLTGVKAVAASHATLALKTDGTVWSWGRNDYGQLGDGTTAQRSTPMQISNLWGIVAVASSNSHSLALSALGTVYGWGSGYGPYPQTVTSLSNVIAIAAGESSSIAVKADGTVWEWTGFNAPVQVPGLSGVTAVSASDHVMVMKSDGTIWGWGNNSSGQLGDGTVTYSSTPVKATAETSARMPLTISISGNGTVYTPSAPPCTGTCTQWLTSGETVGISPSANSGDIFIGWSGCNSIVDSTCVITMSRSQYITATFAPNTPFTLTATRIGSGSGSVTSISPDARINLTDQPSSSAQYTAGSSITLTAIADNGSSFSGWRGACSGTASCTVQIGGDREVVAVFTNTTTGNPGPVQLNSQYFALLQDAYSSLIANSSVVIFANALAVKEHLVFDRDIAVTLKGGYDSSFGANSGLTILKGTLTITSGSVIMENIVIQ